MAETRFLNMQNKKIPTKVPIKSGGKPLVIEVTANSDDMGKLYIA